MITLAVDNLSLGRRREIAWEETNDVQVVWLNGVKLKKRKIALSERKEVGFTLNWKIMKPWKRWCGAKSELRLISPYRVTPESHIKFTRIKEMITN